MQEAAAHTVLSLWESFYVIVGSSGAALTGLQFVVIALLAETGTGGTSREVDAFGTPTIVHFCTVLLLSAMLSAPWHSLSSIALAVGALGLAGILYSAIIIGRARRTTDYKPVLEDWLWHACFPLASHVTLLGAAVALNSGRTGALFPVGAVCLFLLFIGIHNAWDTVVFIALDRVPKARQEGQSQGS